MLFFILVISFAIIYKFLCIYREEEEKKAIEKKRRNDILTAQEFVLANSKAIKHVAALNNKTNFKKITTPTIVVDCKSLSQYRNFEPAKYLTHQLTDDPNFLHYYFEYVEINKQLYQNYRKEYISYKKDFINPAFISTEQIDLKYAIQYEKEAFENLIEYPMCSKSIKYVVKYTTPSGKYVYNDRIFVLSDKEIDSVILSVNDKKKKEEEKLKKIQEDKNLKNKIIQKNEEMQNIIELQNKRIARQNEELLNLKNYIDNKLKTIDNISSQHQTSKIYPQKSYIEGKRSDLGEYEFRSSWEANIARILNSKKIEWEYERKRFELQNLSYLPDFFLSDGTIIEVKGFWDNESIEKCDMFIRTYPKANYLIVDNDMYCEIESIYTKYKPITNWEKTNINLKHGTSVAVVGLSFLQDKSILNEIKINDNLVLEREKNNDYDQFAISVKTIDGKYLGHIEKKFASIYSKKIDIGMEFSAIVESISKKIIKIKVHRSNYNVCCVYDILK